MHVVNTALQSRPYWGGCKFSKGTGQAEDPQAITAYATVSLKIMTRLAPKFNLSFQSPANSKSTCYSALSSRHGRHSRPCIYPTTTRRALG